MKNIKMFYPKNCQFLVVKFSVYLNRRVFVMQSSEKCCSLAHFITNTPILKHTKNFTTKNGKFSEIFFSYIFFHISAQKIDIRYSLEPPRRGGSNVYPQSMFLAQMRKNNVYPCKPQFHYITVGLNRVKII